MRPRDTIARYPRKGPRVTARTARVSAGASPAMATSTGNVGIHLVPGDDRERKQGGKGQVPVAQRVALEAGEPAGAMAELVAVAERDAREREEHARAHHHQNARPGSVVQSERHSRDEGRVENGGAEGAAEQQRLAARQGSAAREVIAHENHPRYVDERALHIDGERGAHEGAPPPGGPSGLGRVPGKQAQEAHRRQQGEQRIVVSEQGGGREPGRLRVADDERHAADRREDARLQAYRSRHPRPQQGQRERSRGARQPARHRLGELAEHDQEDHGAEQGGGESRAKRPLRPPRVL